MKTIVMLLALLVGASAQARTYTPGTGARYALTSAAGSGELTISIAEATDRRVVVEMYFARPGLLAGELWQQFVLELPPSGAPKLVEGYILTGDGRAPERIPLELLNGGDAMVSDFLISSRADLERWKKGDELVSVPASQTPIRATRYEQPTGSTVVTYWLSEQARPLGLAKLTSRGPKAAQTYDLQLVSVLANVGTKIDRKKAVAISADSRALLQMKAP